MLNGISLLSIYVFDLLLHPLSRGNGEGAHAHGLHRSIGWFYRILWLLPVVGVSLYLNVRDAGLFLLSPPTHTIGVAVGRGGVVRGWRLHFFHFVAGLVVFSYCQAHFYPAAWPCVSVCWDDIDHVAERVHRVPQLARYVCVPCCHDRDVRVRFLCTGLCPRCWRRGGDHFLLLGGCVSEGLDSLISHLTASDVNLDITALSE